MDLVPDIQHTYVVTGGIIDNNVVYTIDEEMGSHLPGTIYDARTADWRSVADGEELDEERITRDLRARLRSQPALGEPVFIVSIDHRYGNTASVHATIEGAKRFIYEWVVDNWTLSAGIPTDYDTAIAEYFDLFSGESVTIEPTRVIV